MRVLIVGCGAVGQVFGIGLQRAEVELGLHDRPATNEKLKQALGQGGYPVFQITRSHRRDPIGHRLEHYQVVASMAEARRFKPDQIWFTTPSTAYHSEWFREFLNQVPSERVVCFVPEGGRPEFLPEKSGDRLVFAGTTFMAWQGDLEGGGGRPEGVNFWLPGLGIPLVGAESACREVEKILKKAGFRVTVGKPDSHMQAAVTAVMTTFVGGLELAGWSLREFRRSAWLKCAAEAAHEAIMSQLPGTSAFQRAVLGIPILTAGFRFATLLLPLLFPFDLEKYLKFHYLKTRDQTLVLLELFAGDGKKGVLPVENIQMLLQALQNSK